MTFFSSRPPPAALLTLAALLALSAVLVAGCQADLTGPEANEAPLVASVPEGQFSSFDDFVSIRLNKPVVVTTSAGQSYLLKLQAALSEDGKARGHASLADVNDRARRFQYHFRQGQIRCRDSAGVADIEFFFGDPDDLPLPLIEITPLSLAPSPLPSRGRRAPARIMWTWIIGDRAGDAGEFFEVDVDHLSIPPEICNGR